LPCKQAGKVAGPFRPPEWRTRVRLTACGSNRNRYPGPSWQSLKKTFHRSEMQSIGRFGQAGRNDPPQDFGLPRVIEKRLDIALAILGDLFAGTPGSAARPVWKRSGCGVCAASGSCPPIPRPASGQPFCTEKIGVCVSAAAVLLKCSKVWQAGGSRRRRVRGCRFTANSLSYFWRAGPRHDRSRLVRGGMFEIVIVIV